MDDVPPDFRGRTTNERDDRCPRRRHRHPAGEVDDDDDDDDDDDIARAARIRKSMSRVAYVGYAIPHSSNSQRQ